MAERPQFVDLLKAKWNEGKLLCVGLDADYNKIPKSFHDKANASRWMNTANLRARVTRNFFEDRIEQTADLVCAFKPNIAFIEDQVNVQAALAYAVRKVHGDYPDIPVIGDVKRADIGNTNTGYARMAYERFGFDAITTNPYFGHDTYDPFLKYEGKGLLILAKTSNPGAGFYQNGTFDIDQYQRTQIFEGTPLSDDEIDLAKQTAKLYYAETAAREAEKYPNLTDAQKRYLDEHPQAENMLPLHVIVALRTATLARGKQNPNIGIVVGATHAEDFKTIRAVAPELVILVPGLGTQQGDLAKTLEHGLDFNKQGLILNNGSKIIFADNPRLEVQGFNSQVTEYLAAA